MADVKLVAITKPAIDGVSSPEEFIAYCARVSNPSNQANAKTSGKLIKYLMKNAHWSPFEMVHVVMEIVTTRDIARQILRHRSFSFQEFSQRYADASPLGFEIREARLQDTKNRQNSLELDPRDERQNAIARTWTEAQERIAAETKKLYQWALDNGIAKEVARAVLPEGLVNSRLYMSGTFRSWYHYCQLRVANGTQKEHRDVALKCWHELQKQFPSIELEPMLEADAA
jgi:thymidylate synthase (FAD)